MKVLIVGGSGFIGRLLIPELLRDGHSIVSLSRRPSAGVAGVRHLRGDVTTGEGLDEALAGVDLAYYFAHSFERGHRESVASSDRRGVQKFIEAARRTELPRVIYLGTSDVSRAKGGDGDPGRMSPHRSSRHEVEHALLQAFPRATSFRAWMILHEDNQFLRFLGDAVRRVPLLPLPRFSTIQFRPVDGRDVARALGRAAQRDELAGQVLDLAGPSVTSLLEIVHGLSRELGLARRVVALPFDPPAAAFSPLVRGLGHDQVLLSAVFESARYGEVLHSQAPLRALVEDPRTAATSIRDLVAAWKRPSHGGHTPSSARAERGASRVRR